MNKVKYFILTILISLLFTSCGTTKSIYHSYYNISVLNDSGKVVYHFPCVKIISRNYSEDYEEVTFKALDGKYYAIGGKKIIFTETTYNTYRRSYYHYDGIPNFTRYPKYHRYHNYGPYRVKRPRNNHK